MRPRKECAGCEHAARTAEVCHAELDALELQRRTVHTTIHALLDQTAEWGSEEEGAPVLEDGLSISRVLCERLTVRVAGMHRLLLRLLEERALFLDGLELFEGKLQRLALAVSACSADKASNNTSKPGEAETQWRARAESLFPGAKGDRGEQLGALATVWRALRHKEEECEVLARMLRKMEVAWHRDESERATQHEEEREEAKAALEERDLRLDSLKVRIPRVVDMLKIQRRRSGLRLLHSLCYHYD